MNYLIPVIIDHVNIAGVWMKKLAKVDVIG